MAHCNHSQAQAEFDDADNVAGPDQDSRRSYAVDYIEVSYTFRDSTVYNRDLLSTILTDNLDAVEEDRNRSEGIVAAAGNHHRIGVDQEEDNRTLRVKIRRSEK